jgi:D-alanyl-lipoteichoic acid acyltransferase DltB (MBOAT superfamily)
MVSTEGSSRAVHARRHKQFGWWSLFLFAALGLVLELLHGFKVQAYLAVSNETRRLMWTLGHAHGVLLALVNIVFGLALETGRKSVQHVKRISTALIGASVLLPGGFLAGGVAFYEGDPGVGVVFVPIGAALLLVALFMLARDAGRQD